MSQGVLRDWSRIAAKLSGRTNKDCRKRWTKICTLNLKKGAWSPEEDEKLKKAVSEIGQQYVLSAFSVVLVYNQCHGNPWKHVKVSDQISSWTQVAQVVGSRHADRMCFTIVVMEFD